MMRTISCTIFALSCLNAIPAMGQELFPTQQRGLTADTAFQFGGVENVNLFNGNLVATIPLGISYPVGPNLSYQFVLSYNSNVWDQKLVACQTVPESYVRPEPDEESNAGLGWQLHLGRLLPPVGASAGDSPERNAWSYNSSDGGRHVFTTGLHIEDDFTLIPPAASQPNTSWTRDGTYLRMRLFPGGSGCVGPIEAGSSAACRRVEFPNGNLHEFRNFSSSGDDWRLTRMRDRFDNWVDVTYPNGGNTWRVADMHGRIHRIIFDAPAGRPKRVRELQVRRFNAGANAAVYAFAYDAATVIDRQKFSGVGDPPDCANDPPSVVVDLLRQVEQPDGSFWAMNSYRQQDASEILSGGLSELILPTGGASRFRYGGYIFHSQDSGSGPGVNLNVNVGVVRKQVFEDAGDASPIGTWTYTPGFDITNNAPGDEGGQGMRAVPCHRTVTVRDPVGHEMVHYFSTTQARHRESFALPFTRCANGVYSPTGPFLSQEVYEGTADSGTKVRSVFVDFVSQPGREQNRNHRQVFQRVVYHDDGDAFTETTFSDFDGLGNHRVETLGGTFATGGNTRSSTTNWNPSAGTFPGSFVMPGRDDPWVLNVVTEQSTTQGSETAVTELCTDPATGFVSRSRVLAAGSSRQARDLLTVLTPDSSGFVVAEEFYGGDAENGMDGTYANLCEMTLPDTNPGVQYKTVHTYAAGTLRTSTMVDPCDDSEVLITADFTIDTNTGLVARSRDPAGVETAFVYDALGRLTSERPAESAWTSTTYQLPTVSQPGQEPRITVQACPNGSASCGTPLSWQRRRLDGLGRLVQEEVQVPTVAGVQTHSRFHTYDAISRKLSESVWNNASLVTSFEQYDRFGRVGLIRPPNHPENPATVVTYEGDRTVTRRNKVVTSAGGSETDSYTTEVFDREGRLVSVCEGSSALWSGSCGGGGIRTDYSYDVGNRLSEVCMVPRGGGSCGQARSFFYDQRGFLTAEIHPEIGGAGNGPTFWSYDALGNVLAKDLEGTNFDLFFTYDPAGRLTRVDQALGGGQTRPLKEFFYGRTNVGTDLRKGKLVQARRHNWVDPVFPIGRGNGAVDAIITDYFAYAGKDGRPLIKSTRYNLGVTTNTFSQAYFWDDLGNVETLIYPRCGHEGCTGKDPQRLQHYGYERGFLTSASATVDGTPTSVAPNIDYQAGGMLHRIDHANGVTEVIGINPADGLRRPRTISTDAGWSTNVYDYDGAGNIKRIGSQNFSYDRLSRLTFGETDTGQTQTVRCDAFGNITSMTTGGVFQSLSTSSTTNRLSLPGTSYDVAGNLTRLSIGGEVFEYEYDGVSMMRSLISNTDQAKVFLYDANNERVAVFSCFTGAGSACASADQEILWTVRDLDGLVLRAWEERIGAGGWRWREDNIFRGGLPLTTMLNDGNGGDAPRHLHLDHLGTPRQITNADGTQVAFHSYYPFGEEATDPNQDGVRLRFTSHERDQNGGGEGTLDYMHARYESPRIGRFISVDPIVGNPRLAQSWNRYSYVMGNPVNLVDLLGLAPKGVFGEEICVTATGAPCGSAERAKAGLDQLILGRAQINSISFSEARRRSGLSVSDFAKTLPPQPCTDFACQVLANVGSNAPFTNALEVGIVFAVEAFIFGPALFVGGGGLAPVAARSFVAFGGPGAAQASIKLTRKAKRILGNTRNLKDMTVRDAILSRGGTGRNVQRTGRFAGEFLGNVGNAAARGDQEALKAVKIVKGAGRLGQRRFKD